MWVKSCKDPPILLGGCVFFSKMDNASSSCYEPHERNRAKEAGVVRVDQIIKVWFLVGLVWWFAESKGASRTITQSFVPAVLWQSKEGHPHHTP